MHFLRPFCRRPETSFNEVAADVTAEPVPSIFFHLRPLSGVIIIITIFFYSPSATKYWSIDPRGQKYAYHKKVIVAHDSPPPPFRNTMHNKNILYVLYLRVFNHIRRLLFI